MFNLKWSGSVKKIFLNFLPLLNFFDNLRLGTKVGFHEPGCGRTAPEINLNQPSSNHPISLSDFSYRNVLIYFFTSIFELEDNCYQNKENKRRPEISWYKLWSFSELNVERLKFFLIWGFQCCFMPLRTLKFIKSHDILVLKVRS